MENQDKWRWIKIKQYAQNNSSSPTQQYISIHPIGNHPNSFGTKNISTKQKQVCP